MPTAGNGSSTAKVVAAQRRHRPDLDERRLARDAAAAAARQRATRHASEAGARAPRARRPQRSARSEEAVEEPARQHDVVVEQQQPVEGARDRRPSSSALRFSNLPSVAGARARARSTSQRERAQLRERRARRSPRFSGAHDREHEHAAREPRGARAPRARARCRRRATSSARSASARSASRRPPTVPLSPERKSSRGVAARHGRARAGRARARCGPQLCAAITGPLAQRRRSVCQRQPASTRSSAASAGARSLLLVEVARLAPAQHARRASAPRSVASRGARRWSSAGAGDVADPPAGAQVAAAPTPPRRRPSSGGADRSRPTASKRAAADRHVRAPRARDVAVLGAEVHVGDRRRPRGRRSAGALPRPSRRARIGPGEHVDVGVRARRRRAARRASRRGTSTSSSMNASSSPSARRDARRCGPRSARAARRARRSGRRSARRARALAGEPPSSTTITSAPAARACGATEASATSR